MMTDPLSDMLTRIRNANRIERPAVDMPASNLKARVAQVLKDEGYIIDFQVGEMKPAESGHDVFSPVEGQSHGGGPKRVLRVFLKYGPEGEKVIRRIERASKPGLRLYVGRTELRPVLDGLGIAILSTSRGVMSDRQARAQKVGGELLCRVW